MASTSRLTSSHSEKDPTKAIHDPFGYGYEGRIGVDRETSTRRKGIAAVLHQFATRGLKAPEAAQYDYLITHGFYTAEELKEHPGRPAAKNNPIQNISDSADEERVATELAEYIIKVDKEKCSRRNKRITRWELIRREERLRKPAPRTVTWAFQEPGSRSGSETDEEREILLHEEGVAVRGGSGRGRGRGGRGRGSSGRGRGRGDGDAFAQRVSGW